MKIKSIVQGMIGATLLLAGTHAYAATYYFSTSGNNTTGIGTQASPFYSLCGPWPGAGCATGESKIALGQMAINPGDTLLFKRGDEWVGLDSGWTINATGAPGNPITFGAYGDSGLARPIFRGAKTAYELGVDNWTNVPGTSIWYASGIDWWPWLAAQEATAPGGPQLYGAFSVQGVNNASTGGWTSNQSMVRGTYFYDNGAQRFYVWRTDNLKPDHAAGRDVYLGVWPNDGTDRLVKVWRGWAGGSADPKFAAGYFIFQDLHVKLSRSYGFATSYANTQFINCLSELNAQEGFIFDRRRFGAPLPGAKDGVMRNCVARWNNMAPAVGIGQGITVESENVWIYDTESYENAMAGIDFLDYDANTKTDGGGIVNCKVHHNGIQPVAQFSFDANIYIDGGSNITIRDTQVWAAGVDPRGVKTRVRPNAGISVDLEPPAFNSGKRPNGIKIINTVSYGNMGPAISIGKDNGNQGVVDSFSNIQLIGNTFQRDRGDSDIPGYYGSDYFDQGNRVVHFYNVSSGFIFKNNIVLSMNSARAPVFGDIDMLNAGKSRMDLDNNIYYCPGCNYSVTGDSNAGGFFSYAYIQNLTIDQFRNLGAAANLQQDTLLSKAVMTANPLLTNTTMSNFDGRLISGSPAIDIANTSAFPILVPALSGTTRADGAADSPYNDLGYHYPLVGASPPPPTPDTEAPTAPTGLTAVQSGAQILLSWNASTDNVGVSNYQVFNSSTQLGTSPSTGYTVNSVTQGQVYTFTVKAQDAAGNTSSPSNTVTLTVGATSDTTPPTAPSGLTATLSGTQVSLSWNAATDNVAVTIYDILNSGTSIGTSTSTSFLHTGTGGLTYNYSVKAKDAAGNTSASSNIVTVTVPTQPAGGPPAPTNVTAQYVSGQVQLAWSASTGAWGYNVYRDGSYLKTTGSTSTYDNGVVAGTTYTYNVKAYDAASVKSVLSNNAVITIPGGTTPPPVVDTTAPSVPANLAHILSGTVATLTWNASTDNVGVTGYEVYDGAILRTTVTSLSYIASGLTAGQSYAFSIKAKDAANNLSASSAATTVNVPAAPPPPPAGGPAAPTGLTAAYSSGKVQLAWTASTGAFGYNLYRNDNYVKTVGNQVFAEDSAVTAGVTYTYNVKAYDAASIKSAYSNSAVITIPGGGAPADTTAPSVPANLLGTVSGTSVNLSWTASTDNVAVTGYQVFQGTTLLGTSASPAYPVANLPVGSFTFSVKAYDAANNISASSASVTISMSGPGTPTDLIAFVTGQSVGVAWTSVANAAGYALYRTDIFLKNVTGASTTDSTVSAGQTYSYKVQAYDSFNRYSGFSNAMSVTMPIPTDTTAPSAPTSLGASLSGTTANLTWNASTDNVGVTGYQVYQGAALKGTTTSTTYSVSALSEGQTYAFTVRAYDAANNNSASSNTASVTVPVTPPTGPVAPTGLAATFSAGKVQLTWNASASATGYNVYRDDNYLKTVGSQTFADDGTITAGVTYTYNVKAYDAASVKSPYSNNAVITIPSGGAPPADTTAPSAPTSLGASLSGTTANLTWNASTDNVAVTSYQVFQGATLKSTVTTLNASVSGLTQGQSYNFTVKAIDAAGNVSASSNTASVTVPTSTAPATPTSFNVSAPSSGNISMNWTASAGADGYTIYRNGAYLVTTTSANYSEHPGGGTWRYKVQAFNNAGQTSAFTNEITVSTSR